ncbi:MAG: DNA replication/repair protein RecF [Myxococcales bacterium]|nr:DNA replication/repair protein RecF [Myxococcales bacterium]
MSADPQHASASSEALRVERLFVRGFRNLERLDFEPGPRFNVIHGDNGAGKSNLLEAIHYMGSLRSFRGAKTEDIVRLHEPNAVLKARVSGDLAMRTYTVGLERGKARKLQLDDKRPRSLSAWHGTFPMVLFHPGDTELAGGSPELRRAFLDRMLEQLDPAYASALATYTKALRSRNRLLKQDPIDPRSVRSYDAILADAGAVVGRARASLVTSLAPRVAQAFHDVAGQELPLDVSYRPRVAPEREALLRALEQAFDKDCARGFTADGPHADDLALSVRAIAAKHHASQGQQRAIVLALKVAELDELTARSGKVPVLLLDDVSSELDRGRNRRLFDLLSRLGGQVFLTTTHPEFILLDEHRRDFHVAGGVVSPDSRGVA